MLSPRSAKILKYIVSDYIARARPVPSQVLVTDYELGVSSATVRNEMVYLEREGYILRPHTSAGCVPSDKGYRAYVESLGRVELPVEEQRQIGHLFHQVEKELSEWLSLAASVAARLAQNAALIAVPQSGACRLKHMELVSMQDHVALLVLVLEGARLRQQLITFGQPVTQPELTAAAFKFNTIFTALTSGQIRGSKVEMSAFEQMMTDHIAKVMEDEDSHRHEESYLDGIHLILSQPEFAANQRVQALLELFEERRLLRSILPDGMPGEGVQVLIGKENRSEAMQDYSLVVSRYGSPAEARGMICIIGPTRMQYAHTIAAVTHLSSVLSILMRRLYGRGTPGSGTESSGE